MSHATLSDLSNRTEHADIPAPKYRWGLRILVPAVLILSLGGMCAGSVMGSLTPALDVEVIPVVQRAGQAPADGSASVATGAVLVQAAGWIEPDPFPISVTALASGTVREVLVLEGQSVRAGDLLVHLIDEDAIIAQRRAVAELAAAQTAWDANIEATRAHAVAVAMELETSASLGLARAELASAQASREEARRNFKRQSALQATGSSSEYEFNAAEAELGVREAAAAGAVHRIAALTAQLDRATAERRAAERNLELRTEEKLRLDLARVMADEATLAVERLEIRAPITGVVMSRLVEPGSRLMLDSDSAGGAMVAQLYDPKRLQVRVDVPLADAGKIGFGQPAEVTAEILPNRVFRGTVSRVTNLADIQKNTLQVKVALEDPAPELKPEMLARVRFHAASTTAGTSSSGTGGLAVFAPATAVREGSVWVVNAFDGEFGNAAKRAVKPAGAPKDGWLQVADGLNPGDLVIVSDNSALVDGIRVRTREGKE